MSLKSNKACLFQIELVFEFYCSLLETISHFLDFSVLIIFSSLCTHICIIKAKYFFVVTVA